MVLIVCNNVNAQVITLIDKNTGDPIQDASIISNTPSLITMTNSLGQVDISEFENLDYIQLLKIGYKRQVKSYQDLISNDRIIQLEPFAFSGDAVIVSASKWAQNVDDIPARIVGISPSEIALQNPQTAADLLGSSGEVFIQKSQLGGGSPMIRGFATNRLLYTIDGVRMNNAIFRGGNIQNVISLDAFSMEATEILFGPGSVIYGSDAIGAVMSFRTRTPELSYTEKPLINGSAVSRYASSSNEKTVHFDVNVGWKKWAMVTSFTSSEFGDLRMGSHGPDEYLRPFYVQRQDSMDVIVENEDPLIQNPTGYSQINLMQKVRFKPNKNWNFEYGFHLSESSSYSRYDRHIRYKDGLPRYGEWSYGPQKWMMNNLNITHSHGNKIYDQMSIRLAQQSFEESRISRDFNKNDRETRIENVIAYSGNIDFIKSLGKRNTLKYGGEFVLNEVNSRGINEDISTGEQSAGPSRYPQADWVSTGIYITNEFKANEKLILTAGIRYSQFQINADFDTSFYDFPFTSASLNNGALTGSIGTVYHPTKNWSISANFSTAYRAPNVDDIGKVFDSEPGAVVVPNPNLEAEYAYNGELSITKIFGNRLKLDITGFYTLLDNALVRRDYQLNGADSINYDGEMSKVQAIQNAAVATVYGLQTGFELKLGGGFSINSRFNYQLGEEELDDGSVSPSRHAAPWFGISRLKFQKNHLSIELNSQYSGEKAFEDMSIEEISKDYMYAIDDNGNPYSPAWYTINLKAMYRFTDHLSVSGGIENITDQRYRPYSSGIVSSGRNVILSLKAIF